VADADDSVLEEIEERFRSNPGRRSKQALRHVTDVLGGSDWITGPGDDAALVSACGGTVLAAGEAIHPAFVAADPFGAGVGAVVANCNDVAAMGGRPLAIVDTVVASDRVARQLLAGLRHAADLYGVPVVGGHLTAWAGEPSLSAFVLGEVVAPLSATHVSPGQRVLLAACLEGRLRGDFPFYPSYEQRGTKVQGDLALLPLLAERGAVVAAKDVSMAGLLGTLAMLLQPTGCGADVDLDRLPRPPEVPLPTWFEVFPSYAFLLCAPQARVGECVDAFADRGLTCAEIGRVRAGGELRVRLGGGTRVLLRDTATTATGLAGASTVAAAGDRQPPGSP
jgi:uncharacterized protein